MNGPQVVRALRQPCILLGLDAEHAAALAVPDAQALQSALGLLDAMLERIDVELGGEPERLAPATRDRVGELASRGLTDPEIAAALGLSPSAVRSARRRGGIAPGAPYARVRTGWQQRIGEAHARGLTTPEIAEATGYTVRTVQQRLAELGLKAHRRP